MGALEGPEGHQHVVVEPTVLAGVLLWRVHCYVPRAVEGEQRPFVCGTISGVGR